MTSMPGTGSMGFRGDAGFSGDIVLHRGGTAIPVAYVGEDAPFRVYRLDDARLGALAGAILADQDGWISGNGAAVIPGGFYVGAVDGDGLLRIRDLRPRRGFLRQWLRKFVERSGR